jgi:hypothetical protein
MKLSARTVFALLSLDKEWSQSVRVSICCSVRSILADFCNRSYMAARASKASTSNRRQTCLLPTLRASNNILTGKIYRPSVLPFLYLSLLLSLSFCLSNLLLFISCSFISLRGIYTTFIGFCFLPLHGIAYCVLPMQPSDILRCYSSRSPPPPVPSPSHHHFTNYPSLYSLLYLSEMVFDPSQGS